MRLFSDSDWIDFTFSKRGLDSSASWLTIEMKPLPVASKADATTSRQRWLAMVQISTEDLVPGMYSEAIEFSARSHEGRNWRQQFRVDLDVRPEVVVVPASLFVSEITPGQTISKTILFRFADDESLPSREDISMTHNLPFDTRLELSESQARTAKGTVVFGPLPGTLGTIRGELEFTLGKPLDRELSIPVVVIDGKRADHRK